MLMPIITKTMRMIPLMIRPAALSTGLQSEVFSSTLKKMSKPMSTMPDGESEGPSPFALPAMVRSESIIAVANVGPLVSSHQKNPVKTVKRTNSAKNSPMSALLSVMMPNVHTMEMMVNVQNNHEARDVM